MQFDSLGGREDGEYNDVCFVELSKACAIEDAMFLERCHFTEFNISIL